MLDLLDGFYSAQKDAFVGFDPQVASRFYDWLQRLAGLLKVEVVGLQNLPEGRALLVANHGFGWDVAFPMGAIWQERQRPVYALGEHLWWRVPFLRRLAAAVGTVDGTRDNVDQLLQSDQTVLVLPGGLREAVKPRELRYRLLWGHRYGFVKAALRNGTPLIPLAALGSDELFDFVGDAYARGRRWLHVSGLPIPLPARILPIPHRVRLRYVIGEPIYPIAPPERAEDPDVLRQYRRLVEGALQELIDEELAHRAGVDI